ncbi:hypothetical protein SD78_4450 [Bacillus badius]|nr:hypothetical protein SD78_4450 [Bacillus badius]
MLQLIEYDKVIAVDKLLGLVDDKQKVTRLEKPKLGEIYGFLLAFEEFCKETIGMDSRIMIQAWNGYDDRYIQTIIKIKEYLIINQAVLDEEAKKQWLEKVFNCTWERRLKG